MFDPVDPKQRLPELEEGILRYWREEDIFKRSLKQRSALSSDVLDGHWKKMHESFSFYDGPPFATGLPHYGHLLAGTIKDVIPRYQTMRGKYVERRFGWDCHGLPVENIIEKEQGITSHKQIEEMGVDKFNALCRAAVQRHTKEWRTVVERMGRFVDMDHDYRTMDPEYMESIWWVFSELWKKKLIYEGYKPMYICPRCATPLSNFEVTQGYQERQDLSVIVTLPLGDDPKTVLLAWTTTPWSLPGNMWLAIGRHIKYVMVEAEGMRYILARNLVEKVFGKREFHIVKEMRSQELVGLRYVPLFPYFTDVPSEKEKRGSQTYGERVYKVVMYDDVEVSDMEGTGIVHATSCLGEDSYRIAMGEGVDILWHVGIDGVFSPEVKDFAGMQAKPEGKDPMATDKAIVAKLREWGRVFDSFPVTHSYPHCWRCDTPLLPYTTSSWFVSVEKIKEDLLQTNAETAWVPEHVRDGRFGKWLEGARDWAISRNRYWGTPLPIWRTERKGKGEKTEGDVEVIQSRDDLMAHCKIRFTKVTALRHAESEGNLIPIYQGKCPGSPLTEHGRAQAQVAADFLQSSEISAVYCSPLDRTKETATLIAKATGAPVIVDERLREVSFGDFEGKTVDYSDLTLVKARRAHKLEKGTPESIYHFPGMETWSAVHGRIKSFLDDTLPLHRGGHIVIVTHADPLQNIRHFFNLEDPVKLSHQPYPRYAEPFTFFWDHNTKAQLDLHKHIVDEITWGGSPQKTDSLLTLVRHGQTDYNAKSLVNGGNIDTLLNETGRAQVHALAKKIKKQKFDLIISSDLKRAVETAEILSAELKVPHVARWKELRERDTGEWTGKPGRDYVTPLPSGEVASPGLSPLTPPGGESFGAFLQRLEMALKRIRAEYPGKRVLVACHGGPLKCLQTLVENLSLAEAAAIEPTNAEAADLRLSALMQRIPEVLDCWFESGSMPYAQSNFPFSFQSMTAPSGSPSPTGGGLRDGGKKSPNSQFLIPNSYPPGFPADFIAEGMDQTRGWFYTLMILSTALYKLPAFRHCIVNGIVLAEDGRKMSKRLKNYPEPMDVVNRHGADAVRYTLMASPAVKGEDLRFSEKLVEETVRSVLLPLWNVYGFFVTYSNAAKFEPAGSRRHSRHPLDQYIRAEVQDLVNRMTRELDAYDLSAACAEIHDTIDALTNWYVRLSRRRFAGKGAVDEEDMSPAAELEGHEEEQLDALATLEDVLLTVCQVLAPFCPYITDAITLNLVPEEHGSVHLTDWPEPRELTAEEHSLIIRNRLLRQIVSLGHAVRSGKKIKVRQPLARAVVALPPALTTIALTGEDRTLLMNELNVKDLEFTDDPGAFAKPVALVDARKVGPRLGARVQEVIRAGKAGDFTVRDDGSVLILDEVLSSTEVQLVYRGATSVETDGGGSEGQDTASDHGLVVSMETHLSEDLKCEGCARDLIRAVQKLRKEAGFAFTDRIALSIDGLPETMKEHGEAIAQETNAVLQENNGLPQTVEIDGKTVTVRLAKL